MKFIINVRRYRCGDYDYYTPKEAPLEGAVLIENTAIQKEKISGYHQTIAILDENGDPALGKRWIESKPSSFWEKYGFNHRREGDFWLRDVEANHWEISISTLEELAKLEYQHGFELSFGDEGTEGYITISKG